MIFVLLFVCVYAYMAWDRWLEHKERVRRMQSTRKEETP